MELLIYFSHEHPLEFIQDDNIPKTAKEENDQDDIPDTVEEEETDQDDISEAAEEENDHIPETAEENDRDDILEIGENDQHDFPETTEGENDEACCYGCKKEIEGPRYYCSTGCKFYFHKMCAELELGLKIDNPIHPHPLILLPNSPYPQDKQCFCSLCRYKCLGYVFHCKTCDFFQDIDCAFLPLSTFGKLSLLEHCSHQHPLLLIEKPTESLLDDCCCDACEEKLSGPFCSCLGCVDFGSDLHKHCAEDLPLEINPPFHPHPLFLLPSSPYPEDKSCFCSLCRYKCLGFVFQCKTCDFFLDIYCAFLPLSTFGNISLLEHFSHPHPLLLIAMPTKRLLYDCCCDACGEKLSGPFYRCLGCMDFGSDLHKHCAEDLPLEINSPLHPHPLFLLLRPPNRHENIYYSCNVCYRACYGFVYHCTPCNFGLDLICGVLQLSAITKFPKLEHFSHNHSLYLIDEEFDKVFVRPCAACEKELSGGTIYRCVDCGKFDLHKECAEPPREINHPFHSHPLILLARSPSFEIRNGIRTSECRFCHGLFAGCVDCDSFDLYKECAELPLEINHPYHRKHPLILLPNPPIHPEKCSCYWCKIQYKRFIYYCSSCNFGLNPENVSLPRMITVSSHEHPWILLSACISFICNFCGTDGECAPYVCSLCTSCDRVVHKNCISLPQKIKTRRHVHIISHTYFLPDKQPETRECKICHDEVNTEYGSYYCSASGCNYIAHVKCATAGVIWEEAVEDQEEWPDKSLSLITDVIEKVTVGEEIIATEIKHAYHEHSLIMTFVGEVEQDCVCDGCMRSISVPFYSCKECEFFLHRLCAELPRVKEHAIHKHRLTLKKNFFACCVACNRFHHGFRYICDEESCRFEIDIQCSLLSDSLMHPSHQHMLLLTDKYKGNCSHCNNKNRLLYRCKESCGFALGFECVTLPLTTRFKYDKHPLSLTYYDGSDPCQLYCDSCEEERHRKDWYYHCVKCDNSVHPICVLRDLPFIKPGSLEVFDTYPHRVKFVKKLWNSPLCHVCHKLCSGQALECTYFCRTFHFKCITG
ncbi:DC1 domain-containing protein [Corchorus olitorius]|uniref:DC1 domain-containing protein n=1 Tax=Corchorus olitorius TaxID=93759 RepID=A0A1R3H1U3_9ROSI|nr:DC1 domain-containing protein [Corchorus olitorius]